MLVSWLGKGPQKISKKVPIYVLLVSSILLSGYSLLMIRRYKGASETNKVSLHRRPPGSTFYDSLAPDFEKYGLDGKSVRVSDYAGELIILRFSPFYLNDLSSLLYLDHLANRFSKRGVRLFFINSRGKHYPEQIRNMVSLTSTIIEDDGSLMELYDAEYDDTIIIGRDFRIKFKYNRADKATIYQEIVRYAIFEDSKEHQINSSALKDLLLRLSFKNLRTNKRQSLADALKGQKTLLNLLVSPCFSCPETRRFTIIKEVAERSDVRVVMLFGKGNGDVILKEYLERYGLDSPRIEAGIIEEGGELDRSRYYEIYQYDIDPRIIILDKTASIIFLEEKGDDNKIDAEFLIRKLY